MENKVTVKSNPVAYAGNPEFGYVVLNSVEEVIQNGWIQEKERTCLLRGMMKSLVKFPAGRQLAGKIAVIECTEDNIHPSVIGELNKSLGYEEQIAGFLKRAGSEDAPVLMAGGKRILRFTVWDSTGNQSDLRVAHDNIEAVKAYNATKSGSAKLPS